MSVIVRYILRDLGVAFLFGFAAFTFLLLVVGLVQEALEMDMPLIYVWQLIPFVFAKMSTVSLPVTLLLAVTTFFARMSGNNEVVALKALGIPPKAFLTPVFAVAILVSVIGVGINERSVTWGQQGINAVCYYAAEDILIRQLTKNHRFETPNKQITILVKGMDGQRRLIKPTIMLKKESITIEAETAQITMDFSAEMLTVTLTDFRVIGEKGGFKIAGPSRTERISLAEIVPSKDSSRPSNMGLNQIDVEKKKAAEQIEQQRRIIAAHRTFGASMGSVDSWAMPKINYAKGNIRAFQSYQNRLSVEPPRRWATGFCCFFFVWLGAPLAIWMRKSDFFSSFFACFVPILLLFYPLLMFGLTQAKNGTLPPMCVWTANVAIGLVGFWFLRQIHRY